MHQNPFSAGALPRTLLRELATLLNPLVGWGGSPPHTLPASRLSGSRSGLRTNGASVLRHMSLCH